MSSPESQSPLLKRGPGGSSTRFGRRGSATDYEAWSAFVPKLVLGQLDKLVNAEGNPIGETFDNTAVLFADASGFTALTERLATQPDGAEVVRCSLIACILL